MGPCGGLTMGVSTEHRSERSLHHSWDTQTCRWSASSHDRPVTAPLTFPLGFSFVPLSWCSKTPDPAQQPSQWASLRVQLAAVLCVVTVQDSPSRNASKTELRFPVECCLRWSQRALWVSDLGGLKPHPEAGEDLTVSEGLPGSPSAQYSDPVGHKGGTQSPQLQLPGFGLQNSGKRVLETWINVQTKHNGGGREDLCFIPFFPLLPCPPSSSCFVVYYTVKRYIIRVTLVIFNLLIGDKAVNYPLFRVPFLFQIKIN